MDASTARRRVKHVRANEHCQMTNGDVGLSVSDQVALLGVIFTVLSVVFTIVSAFALAAAGLFGAWLQRRGDQKQRWDKDRFEAFAEFDAAAQRYYDHFRIDGTVVNRAGLDASDEALRKAYSRASLIRREASTARALDGAHDWLLRLPKAPWRGLTFQQIDESAFNACEDFMYCARHELGLVPVAPRTYAQYLVEEGLVQAPQPPR